MIPQWNFVGPPFWVVQRIPGSGYQIRQMTAEEKGDELLSRSDIVGVMPDSNSARIFVDALSA